MDPWANSPLSLNSFVVKEHVGMFKAANNFDMYDPQSGRLVLECREEKLGGFTKLLRFTDYKRMTPFHIEIREPGGETLIEIKRGVSFLLSEVEVFDGEGNLLGSFKQKFFSIGGKFDVYSAEGEVLCSLKGKWTGWDFSFGIDGMEFAHVSKQWSGFGKELFTSADNYMLQVAPSLEPDHPLRKLIIAAVMCIDMVLKE
ncbi:phospholipid scramblase-related protein [Pelagicoccus enzymogenes]